ncbi:MAG: ribosomal L7Ae/L30e/S12e/Gadd45 family protein [Candidatus Nanoarchaeia archaeon]|nr:ribosomal L7Ae/L30e/S12e/Gadd45 family protein [Candidatus Nanoarchaeia archaeon]
MADEITDMALEAIEKARKSGKIKKGANEAIKALEKGAAKLVVVAKDVNPPEIIMPFKPLCAEKKVPLVTVSTKEELGASAGLPVGTSAVAVIVEGDAKDVIRRIAEMSQ